MPINPYLTHRLRAAGAAVVLALCALLAADPASAQQAPAAGAGQTSQQDIAVRGDLVIEAGESAHDVVVYGGNLTVRGRVTGDAAVFGGNLVLADGGEVLGDAIVAGGQLVEEGGRVAGEMRVLDDARALARDGAAAGAAAAATERSSARDISREVREAVREAQREARAEQRAPRQERSWFDRFRRGLASLLSTLALAVVLGGAGAALVFYGRPYLETVSDTVRASAMRAGAVGLAASFLAVPGLIVLIVVLVVTIVGIPLLVAVPLYPLAFIVATVFGLLGVAHAIGERTAEQRRESFDLRYRNSFAYLFTGLAMFFAPWLAADLLGMVPFLGFVSWVLRAVMVLAVLVAAWIGLGAVILSRAGTRRTFAAPLGPPDLESDPLFDRQPSARGSDV
jgi:hypothetical protein